MNAASSGPQPPDLGEHYARMATDRHLRAGKALAAAMKLPRGASVLELGSGTGLLSEYLADCVGPRGDVLGLDASPYHMLIAHQRARPNLRFQVGSALDLARFPRGCFDAIVANGALQAWPQPDETLAELRRLLRPGGSLGLVTACAEHPHPVAVVQAAVLAREPYCHHPVPPELREYGVSEGRLGSLLRAAGFDTVEQEAQPDIHVHSSANAAVEFVLACSWGQMLSHLPEKPENLRLRARTDIVNGLERLRTAEGIRHRGLRLQVVACVERSPGLEQVRQA